MDDNAHSPFLWPALAATAFVARLGLSHLYVSCYYCFADDFISNAAGQMLSFFRYFIERLLIAGFIVDRTAQHCFRTHAFSLHILSRRQSLLRKSSRLLRCALHDLFILPHFISRRHTGSRCTQKARFNKSKRSTMVKSPELPFSRAANAARPRIRRASFHAPYAQYYLLAQHARRHFSRTRCRSKY